MIFGSEDTWFQSFIVCKSQTNTMIKEDDIEFKKGKSNLFKQQNLYPGVQYFFL